MNSLEIAQLLIKAARYVPFGMCAVIVILSRVVVSPRSMRAAATLGGAAGLGMVGWLARYFLEQSAPPPSYGIVATAGAILSIASPQLIYDWMGAFALAVAFAAIVPLLPPKEV